MHYLFKFGYDGRVFTGFQRGNGRRSVEDSIMEVLASFGISDGFRSAARTDRGVSAAGNAIKLESSMGPGDIAGILNSRLQDMFFHSCAEVDGNFRVRFSSMKHYRYIIHDEITDPGGFSSILMGFRGTHDFSLFSRNDERSPLRTVSDIKVSRDGSITVVDVYGPNFVWNQIREMIGFALYHSSTGSSIEDPFSVDERRWSLVDPEPLILMDTSYEGVEFRPCFNRGKKNAWGRKAADMRVHASILESIMDTALGGR